MSKNFSKSEYALMIVYLVGLISSLKVGDSIDVRKLGYWEGTPLITAYKKLIGKGVKHEQAKIRAGLSVGWALKKIMKKMPSEDWVVNRKNRVTSYTKVR